MSEINNNTTGSNVISAFLKSRSLYVNILTAFVGLLVVTVLTIVWYTYYHNSKVMFKLCDDLMNQVTKTVIEKTTNYLMPVSVMVELGARLAQKGALALTDNEQLERFAIEIIKSYPQIAMFNIGDEQGNFLMPKKLPDGTIATKIINRNVSPPIVTWKYRDRTSKLVKTETSTDADYDPRTRPWYKGAKESMKNYWANIYIFFTDQKPGITSAYPVTDNQGKFYGVFGLDIELGEMSNFLQTLKIGKTGVAFIINRNNEVVAYPDVSRIVKSEDGKLRPVHIEELGIDSITASFREYERTGASKSVVNTRGKRYIASFTKFPRSFAMQWKVAVVVPEDDFIGAVKKANQGTFLICLVILLISVIFATLISRSISKPIRLLTEETKRIRDFHLDDKIEIKSSIREIHLISNAISKMKTGLQAFRRYIPAELVRQLIRTGEEARLGGYKRELTVFFSDIAGFTTIAESLAPEELMLHLSEYFDELTKIVSDQKGTVDKYIGDAIMAFWGAPVPDADHAFHACSTALLCQKKIEELNKKWEREGKAPFPTRIGINTGETIVGNMGSSERINYTVIGDNVNLASRLEGVNKFYGTNIIVSQATYDKVANKFLFRPLDIIAVRGRKEGTTIYELAGRKEDDETAEIAPLCKEFTKGFKSYLEQDWNRALEIFKELLKNFPSDATTKLYYARCLNYKDNPPGPDWEGIEYLEYK